VLSVATTCAAPRRLGKCHDYVHVAWLLRGSTTASQPRMAQTRLPWSVLFFHTPLARASTGGADQRHVGERLPWWGAVLRYLIGMHKESHDEKANDMTSPGHLSTPAGSRSRDQT